MLDIVLLSPHEGLRHGKDAFVIEFRSTTGGNADRRRQRAGQREHADGRDADVRTC